MMLPKAAAILMQYAAELDDEIRDLRGEALDDPEGGVVVLLEVREELRREVGECLRWMVVGGSGRDVKPS